MRTKFSIFLLIIFSFVIMSFISNNKKTKDDSGFNEKDIDKSLVKIKDSLFAGKCEVTNLQYHYWGYDLYKSKKTEMNRIYLPDTMNWGDKLAYNEPLIYYYFRHPAYQNYPVVNITYEAANLFCEWLTEKYNSSPKRKFNKVIFRLPTEKEWEMAAKGGDDVSIYPWGNRLMKDGKIMCNYSVIGDECLRYDTSEKKVVIDKNQVNHWIAGSLSDAADITAPVLSYYPNNFGLYNVCGNVAEMVSEKGISRGGGWKNAGGDVQIKSIRLYSESATDLGFRYFMEVIEE